PADHFGDEPPGRCVDDVDLRLRIRHEARAGGDWGAGKQQHQCRMSNAECRMSWSASPGPMLWPKPTILHSQFIILHLSSQCECGGVPGACTCPVSALAVSLPA